MATDNTFLAPTTSAATSDELLLQSGDVAHVSCNALGTGEAISLECYQGSAWAPVFTNGPVILTAADMAMVLCGPGQFRFKKPATALAVGLYVDQ